MPNVLRVDVTPNPNAKKFVLDAALSGGGVRQFGTVRDAAGVPFAEALFALPGVESVFCMNEFVTVGKTPDTPWRSLEPQVSRILAAAVAAPNGPVREAATEAPPPRAGDPELLKKIDTVIETSVKPALAGDGGGLEILGLDDTTLRVRYQGACGTCPSATAGTLQAVENLLRRLVDDRIRVVAG